jgi:uridine kinase
MVERHIIGIAGGTASGKTTLSEVLHRETGNQQSVIIKFDSYYRDRPDLSFQDRASLNYDHPDAFDTPLFVAHLKALKRGETIEQPTYDYIQHRRAKQCIITPAAPVIIVEGILIFSIPEILNLIDFKVFVETPADIRILRRVRRDIEGRGRSFSSVTEQYLKTVRPMHDLYVEPSKVHADIIVPEGGFNQKATDLLLTKVAAIIADFKSHQHQTSSGALKSPNK